MLEGLFEVNGGVYVYQRGRRIQLNAPSIEGSILLVDLLNHVGIAKPRIFRDESLKEGVGGVILGTLDDLRKFASNIHSGIPEKEEKLRLLRERYSLQGSQGPSFKELLNEWIRVSHTLGKPPTLRQLRKLKKEEKTQFSGASYAYKFGQKSFIAARENIERILQEHATDYISMEEDEILQLLHTKRA